MCCKDVLKLKYLFVRQTTDVLKGEIQQIIYHTSSPSLEVNGRSADSDDEANLARMNVW